VGSFIGDSWKEWNCRFRDDIRSFFCGENGSVVRIADRIVGSPKIYGHKEREAEQSVNFGLSSNCHLWMTAAEIRGVVGSIPLWNRLWTSSNGKTARAVAGPTYRLEARSVVVLLDNLEN